MMTMKQWLRTLPKPYQTQAFENIAKCNPNIEDIPRQSLVSALYAAFPWMGSSQGHQYWSDFVARCEKEGIVSVEPRKEDEMIYPKITPELIADANIYRYEKKYRDDNLYFIKDINDDKQSLFLREFSGYSNSMRFEFVEMDYDTFMSNDVVKLDRPLKKFKIGDRVRQIKEGKGTNSRDNRKESIVTWVNLNYFGEDGISIDGTGFNHQQFIRSSEAFELVTEPKKETTSAIKVGSKVRYARKTIASYFGNNWPEKVGLVLGNIYTVSWRDNNSVKIEEDSMKYYMHIDHFDLVTADAYDATVTTKEVAQSQSKEPTIQEPVFKTGDRVRCITKNFAAQVGECGIVKKYDPLDFTIYVCVDGGTDSCWVKARYWEIDSVSPEPEENVLLLMLH